MLAAAAGLMEAEGPPRREGAGDARQARQGLDCGWPETVLACLTALEARLRAAAAAAAAVLTTLTAGALRRC